MEYGVFLLVLVRQKNNNKTNFVAFSLHAKYTDRATTAGRRS
jgi:hypothetical protein